MISAELVDARSNRSLWGEQYNRKLSDLLTVQQEIAGEISTQLRQQLTGEEKKQLARKGGTADAEAYQLYLKGRFYWDQRTKESIEKAIAYFEQAIARDPNFALAYVGLSDCYNVLPDYAPVRAQDLVPKTKAEAEKALAIDDTLAEAHTSLAGALEFEWDWAGAEREYKRALELDPNYALAHKWYWNLLASLGRAEEGSAQIQRAKELDPFNLIINTNLGQDLSYRRQYERAAEQARYTLRLDPNFASAHWDLGRIYFRMGNFRESLEESQKGAALENDQEELAIYRALAEAYAASGLQARLRKELELRTALAKRRHVNATDFARLHAQLGEKDVAFRWLNKALEDREYALYTGIKLTPEFDGMRSDPRYKEILKKMKLPE